MHGFFSLHECGSEKFTDGLVARQIPSSGILSWNIRMSDGMMPALAGVSGPGERIIADGASAAISFSVIHRLRTTLQEIRAGKNSPVNCR
jgi:hypothetical protein